MNFNSPASSSLIELTGVTYSFETPNSKLRIKYFQSAVGNSVKNGTEFLKYMRPVRELLNSDKVKDIKQIVQRELDDVRIINSLIPYILNKDNILGEMGVSFFPSVLSVLMPKDYLNDLEGEYPQIEQHVVNDHTEKRNFGVDPFNWSIMQYKDDRGDLLPYSTLTIDKNKCDLVVIDGQHRVNAFRAACDSMSLDDDVIKEIYHDSDKYPNDIDANLPVTVIWFEKIDQSEIIKISPETISRRLFIDVNNSARNIATSRKILLDDKTPSHLITNHFYSLIAENRGFSLDQLSLAHLGFDVPVDTSEEKKNNVPFTYITTPERLKYVFEVFFMRNKKFSIGISSTQKVSNRRSKYSSSASSDSQIVQTVINVMLPYSSNSISQYYDEYLEKSVLFVPEEKQEEIRQEFAEKYFESFCNLFEKFSFYQEYLSKIYQTDVEIISKGTLIEKTTWETVFKKGKGLYYTLKSNAVSSQNKYKDALILIEKNFIDTLKKSLFTDYNSNQLHEQNLKDFFNTLAFQIGYIQAFHQYCEEIKNIDYSVTTNSELKTCSFEFIDRVNTISKSEWVNLYQLTKDIIGGDLHPKVFPTITHLILRRIQKSGEIFDNNQYFAPECEYVHKKCSDQIENIIKGEFGQTERKTLTLQNLLVKISSTYGVTFKEVFDRTIESVFQSIPTIFNDSLKCENNYAEHYKNLLIKEIYENIKVIHT
jgi:hypothetical protein